MDKMHIHIPAPCPVSLTEMQPVAGGNHCAICDKVVIDYSTMTDSQMLDHIKKHGMGCGTFRPDQLDREIKKPRRKLFTYVIAALLLLSKSSLAQQKQDSAMIDACKKTAYEKLQIDTVKFASTMKMGTGTVCVIKRKKNIFYRIIRWLK